MRKVHITLKTTSALSSFGADKTKPEFRITELKALLRMTFRNLYFFSDIDDLKSKEGFLFGSTENKSPVSIKLETIEAVEESGKIKIKDREVNHKYFAKDANIEICLIERVQKETYGIDFIEFYITLLIQASLTGAIGGKSRLGYGHFQVCPINDPGICDKLKKGSPQLENIEAVKQVLIGIQFIYKSEPQGIAVRTMKSSRSDNVISYCDLDSKLKYPYIECIELNILEHGAFLIKKKR